MRVNPTVSLDLAASQPISEDPLQLSLRGRLQPGALRELEALAARGQVDWDDLYRRAVAARLGPLLYASLRGVASVPPSTLQALRSLYQSNSVRNLVQLHELGIALSHLSGGGVPVIVLKGAALAETVYRNIGARPFGDIDLLVHPDHLSALCRLLAEPGYRPVRAETHAGAHAEYENELTLRKPGRVEMLLDIHWSLFDSPYYQDKISMDWFWQTAAPARLGSVDIAVLGTEAEILHLCGHLWLHHGGSDLFWSHDIAEVIAAREGNLDWDELVSQARCHELVVSVRRTLHRIAAEWRLPIPARVLAQLDAMQPTPGEARVFGWLTAESRPVAQRLWADLASTPSWRRRLRFAWSNIVPSSAYMRQRYRIRHAALLPFYYPYRWFLGISSALRARHG